MNNKKLLSFIPESWSRYEYLFAPLLVTLVTIITYGVLISKLGYYRDDWYNIWTAQTRGMEGIVSLFLGDRPFNGWLYVFDYWLVGNAPFGWHLYTLIIRILSSLSFLWLMRSLWPQKKIETTFITLLFVVYPGFYQQPNALTFKHMILAYGSAMLSLAFTIQALKAKQTLRKIIYIILALLLAAFYIMIFEVLIGVEAARFLLIWYYLQRQSDGWKKSFLPTIVQFIPYLILDGTFLFWRIFLFQAVRRATRVDVLMQGYAAVPSHTVVRLFFETAKDLLENTVFAWAVPFYNFTQNAEYRDLFMAFGLGLLVAVFGAIYLLISRDQALEKADVHVNANEGRDWLMLGAIIIIVTTIPTIAAGRNTLFAIQWDRYAYQSSLGVALFFGGIIFHVSQKSSFRWVFLAAMLFIGVVTQYFSADYYSGFWKVEREAWWQLSWRAPQIEKGANLIVSLPGQYSLAEEYEVWAPLNMIYYPKSPEIVLSGQIMFDDVWIDLARGTQENRLVRGTIKVARDYGKTIVLAQPYPYSCLHILDSRRVEQAVGERVDVGNIAPYSNVSFIHDTDQPAIPSREVFGEEPAHTWCYYYEKIDLARQMNNWQLGAKLADEAASLGLEPRDVSEWLPVLEAYIHVDDTKNVKRTISLIRVDQTLYQGLCARYKDLRLAPAEYDRALIYDTLCVR